MPKTLHVVRLRSSWLCGVAGLVLLAGGCGSSHVQPTTGVVPTGVSVSDSGSVSSFVYRVPSGSMEPTVPIGARVDVKRGAPAVGAIVVFHPPEGFATEACGPKPHMIKTGAAACDSPVPHEAMIELIKRVVAGPGDEIYIREGQVYRKTPGSHSFVREKDPYVRSCGAARGCDFPAPIKIPAGGWFLMGDNRRESNDSRFWGPVPTAWIVGVASAPGERPKVEKARQRGSAEAKSAGNVPRTRLVSVARHAPVDQHRQYAELLACLRRSGVRVSATGEIGGAHDSNARVSTRRCRAETLGAQ